MYVIIGVFYSCKATWLLNSRLLLVVDLREQCSSVQSSWIFEVILPSVQLLLQRWQTHTRAKKNPSTKIPGHTLYIHSMCKYIHHPASTFTVSSSKDSCIIPTVRFYWDWWLDFQMINKAPNTNALLLCFRNVSKCSEWHAVDGLNICACLLELGVYNIEEKLFLDSFWAFDNN